MIQKTEVHLLACPFCGQEDNNDSIRLEDDSLNPHPMGGFWIECHSCGARGPEEKSQEDAIKSWDRKPAANWDVCAYCDGSGLRHIGEDEKSKQSNFHQRHCRAMAGFVCSCLKHREVSHEM